MNKTMTCIICPRGCTLTVSDMKVEGNFCKRGADWAIEELTHPVRTVTSVLKVSNRDGIMVSVKTDRPVPKEQIFEVMERIRATEGVAPISVGDVLIKDVCGADIVATKEIL